MKKTDGLPLKAKGVRKVVETVFQLNSDARIEKVIQDQNLHYMHMLFAQGDGLPVHCANGNVYMTVLGGKLTIALDGLPARSYGRGTVLRIPGGTEMNVRNEDAETLELIVIKAPAPTV